MFSTFLFSPELYTPVVLPHTPVGQPNLVQGIVQRQTLAELGTRQGARQERE